MSHVFLNGRFVPDTDAAVPVSDRSFLYGDGLFATIRVFNGKPFRWHQHFERLTAGARSLQIHVAFKADALLEHVLELVRLNRAPDALLRVTVSRGVGPRGYSPVGASQPVLVMTIHAIPQVDVSVPDHWKLITSTFRVRSDDPFTRWKTANKLTNVMARMEAEQAGADEAILLNEQNEVCECSSGNLFWVEQGRVFTPPLTAGILPGVTRAVVMELLERSGEPAVEERCSIDRLQQAQAAFATMSSKGIVTVSSLDGTEILQSPLVTNLHRRYQLLQNEETQ